MFGSRYAKLVQGRWHHVGYFQTSAFPADTLIRKFTMVHQEEGNEFSVVLSSGHFLGFLTQDVDEDGLSGLAGFRDFVIGKYDNPIKRGDYISVRVMTPKAQLEYEGLGGAVPGNLVRTTGAPAIDGSTVFMAPLTLLNGCLQEAVSGDVVVGYFHRLLTAQVDAGNTRVLWEINGTPYDLP